MRLRRAFVGETLADLLGGGPSRPGERLRIGPFSLTLPASAHHHLVHVLRCRPGQPLELYDGRGLVCEAVLTAAGSKRAEAEVHTVRLEPRPPGPRIAVLCGLVKAKAADLVVEKATELGVDLLLFFRARRSVAARTDTPERWKRIATAACLQAGRPHLPEIPAPAGSLLDAHEEAVARLGEPLRAVVFHPGPVDGRRSGPRNGDEGHAVRALVGLVGPEGGLTPEELELARDLGYTFGSLGPFVLRTETAALAASTLLSVLAGRIPVPTLDFASVAPVHS